MDIWIAIGFRQSRAPVAFYQNAVLNRTRDKHKIHTMRLSRFNNSQKTALRFSCSSGIIFNRVFSRSDRHTKNARGKGEGRRIQCGRPRQEEGSCGQLGNSNTQEITKRDLRRPSYDFPEWMQHIFVCLIGFRLAREVHEEFN